MLRCIFICETWIWSDFWNNLYSQVFIQAWHAKTELEKPLWGKQFNAVLFHRMDCETGVMVFTKVFEILYDISTLELASAPSSRDYQPHCWVSRKDCVSTLHPLHVPWMDRVQTQAKDFLISKCWFTGGRLWALDAWSKSPHPGTFSAPPWLRVRCSSWTHLMGSCHQESACAPTSLLSDHLPTCPAVLILAPMDCVGLLRD